MLEKIKTISAVLLVSKNPERLAKFYSEVLGLALKEEKHDATETHYGCELGDIHFAIHPIENFSTSEIGIGSVRLAFNVDDIEIFAKHTQEYGIKLAYPPRDVGFCLMTAFYDPDGNYLEFTKLKKRK